MTLPYHFSVKERDRILDEIAAELEAEADELEYQSELESLSRSLEGLPETEVLL